ncbi:importin-alpha export receptor, partial [Nowakowskiella sp. JEL0078]
MAENDFLMRAVTRVIQISQSDTPLVQQLLSQLVSLMNTISNYPSNPNFNHNVFESISCLARYVCARDPSAVSQFDAALSPVFNDILSRDVQEFAPYVFQILSQLLDLNQGQNLPEHFKQMLPNFLLPQFWESHGNVPALVKLLQSYLTKDSAFIVSSNSISGILGIVQRLLHSRFLDECFQLLMSVFEFIPSDALASYITPVFSMLATKMSQTKSPRIRTSFDTFLFYIISLDKPGLNIDVIIAGFDAIQPTVPNFFEKIYGAVVMATVKEVINIENRRICTY